MPLAPLGQLPPAPTGTDSVGLLDGSPELMLRLIQRSGLARFDSIPLLCAYALIEGGREPRYIPQQLCRAQCQVRPRNRGGRACPAEREDVPDNESPIGASLCSGRTGVHTTGGDSLR